ncbi:MAG: hypothetical protein ABL891_15635, partial [Burkholderiales bacterium]
MDVSAPKWNAAWHSSQAAISLPGHCVHWHAVLEGWRENNGNLWMPGRIPPEPENSSIRRSSARDVALIQYIPVLHDIS